MRTAGYSAPHAPPHPRGAPTCTVRATSGIEQLTGRGLSRLEDKLDFFLALRTT
ncbi:hypothetical protein GO002_04975 [Streptomyces eurocidicus]|nr:hypothetical protein [Streptomyces eurocidicus]